MTFMATVGGSLRAIEEMRPRTSHACEQCARLRAGLITKVNRCNLKKHVFYLLFALWLTPRTSRMIHLDTAHLPKKTDLLMPDWLVAGMMSRFSLLSRLIGLPLTIFQGRPVREFPCHVQVLLHMKVNIQPYLCNGTCKCIL